MAPASLSRVALYRPAWIVLVLVIVGVALNIFTPFWLAPPNFERTFWLYFIVLFAWIPVLIVLMRGRRRVRQIVYVIIGGALLTGCSFMFFRPRSMFTVAVLDSFRCETQPAEPTRVRYACTRHAFEGSQYDQTLIIEGPTGSPILFLVESPRP
jgi:hypothetical protein